MLINGKEESQPPLTVALPWTLTTPKVGFDPPCRRDPRAQEQPRRDTQHPRVWPKRLELDPGFWESFFLSGILKCSRATISFSLQTGGSELRPFFWPTGLDRPLWPPLCLEKTHSFSFFFFFFGLGSSGASGPSGSSLCLFLFLFFFWWSLW